MAEQDIREDQMTVVSSVDYVRGLKGKDSVLVTPSSLMTQRGILHTSFSLSPGEQYELPYKSGLIMIQNSNRSHEKAVATLYGSGNGTVIVPSSTIQFFSEEIGKVCVFNNGENTKYIIKNTRNESQNIIITFYRINLFSLPNRKRFSYLIFFRHILCPLNILSMAEKQDIREEQMTVTNSVDYLRGLKGNNSVLISVLNAISNKAIVNKGHVKTDVLNIVGNYVAYSTSDIDGSGIDGCLISINPTGLEGAQIKVAYNMSIIKVRAAYNVDGAAKWSDWKSITIT